MLTEAGHHSGGEWIKVRTADGRHGYVHKSAARSPIGYRLFANERNGKWRITAFIAGD